MVAITATGGGSQGQEAVCNDIVFLMEATSACGAFLNEIKANYVAPIVEYFNGGAVVEDKVGLAVRGDRGTDTNAGTTHCAGLRLGEFRHAVLAGGVPGRRRDAGAHRRLLRPVPQPAQVPAALRQARLLRRTRRVPRHADRGPGHGAALLQGPGAPARPRPVVAKVLRPRLQLAALHGARRRRPRLQGFPSHFISFKPPTICDASNWETLPKHVTDFQLHLSMKKILPTKTNSHVILRKPRPNLT